MFEYLGESPEIFYHYTSEVYDPNTELGQQRIKRIASRVAQLVDVERIEPKRALDVGCNMGVSSFALESLGFEVVGIDVVDEFVQKAVENAERRGSSAKFQTMDIRKTSFRDEEFGFVAFISNPLPHFSIEMLNEVLAETNRILAPQGVVYLEYADWIGFVFDGDYKDVLVESHATSFHVKFDMLRGSFIREYIDFTNGKRFRLELFLWSPWIVEFLLKTNKFSEIKTTRADRSKHGYVTVAKKLTEL